MEPIRLTTLSIADVPEVLHNIRTNKASYFAPIMHHGKKHCPVCNITGENYHAEWCDIAIDLIGTYG